MNPALIDFQTKSTTAHLHARRRVAERSGFPLEAILHNGRRNSAGEVIHSGIYALRFDP